MRYLPKHKDNKMRCIYIALLVFALICVGGNFQGAIRTVLLSLGLFAMISAIYLLVRYELTSFTYSVFEKDEKVYFAVDRALGRRDGFDCLFSMEDAVYLGKWDGTKTKNELYSKYKDLAILKYYHNCFDTKKSYILFKTEAGYRAVVIEQSDELEVYIRRNMEK